MFLLLVLIIMMDAKNYWVNKLSENFSGYSHIIAFGFPMVLITIVSSDIMYEKYLAKLQDS